MNINHMRCGVYYLMKVGIFIFVKILALFIIPLLKVWLILYNCLATIGALCFYAYIRFGCTHFLLYRKLL